MTYRGFAALTIDPTAFEGRRERTSRCGRRSSGDGGGYLSHRDHQTIDNQTADYPHKDIPCTDSPHTDYTCMSLTWAKNVGRNTATSQSMLALTSI